MKRAWEASASVLLLAPPAGAQMEEHHHMAPEHLGTVHFATSCAAAVQPAFDRATALLHSFAYADADKGFADVAARDPACALAHWGRAMTHYHQFWDVPAGAGLAAGTREIEQAEAMSAGKPRQRALIAALGVYYGQSDHIPLADARCSIRTPWRRWLIIIRTTRS